MQVALTGLGQSGRTSLFAAMGGTAAPPGGGPGGRPGKAPVVAVKVPDARLEWLRDLYKPRKFTPASVEFLDMAGLRFDDPDAKSDTTQTIAALRQADCLVLVVRAFPGDDVPPYRGKVDPVRDREEILAEFGLSDLMMIEKRIETLGKSITKPSKTQEQDKREHALMVRCREAAEAGKPLAGVVQTPEEAKMVKSFGFLTQKPMLWVLNVGETELPEPKIPDAFKDGRFPVFALSAKVERDLAELSEADRAEFASGYGLTEPGKNRVVRGTYEAMGLISFLTAGEDEVRAWTIKKGDSAVEAAGAIHSDLAVSFIKAETVSFADLKTCGDLKTARATGKLRQEGKSYIVQDGDVIEIKAGKAK
jgi:GTP-binding protein YchF